MKNLLEKILKKNDNKTEEKMGNNKEYYSTVFLYLTSIFVACLLLSNILAAKILKIGIFSVTSGILIFPISYIINDILSEVYGYQKAKRVIFCAFALNIFMVLVFELAIILPAPEWFQNSEAFKTILGSTPRIVVAGLVAYLLGALVNSKVLVKMRDNKKNKFGVRAIVSTILGETTDSLIFVPIAFWGTMGLKDLFLMIVLQVALKTAYETVCLPVTTVIVNRIKKYEDIKD